jgi:hypothetical protein
MDIIKKLRNKCGQGCGEKGRNPCEKEKLVQPLWRTIQRFLIVQSS